MPDNSLEAFFKEITSSCTEHAERKGYLDAGEDRFGSALTTIGIARQHAVGEILGKSLEYLRGPRRLLAVKIAGWAWRLWVNAEV